MVDRRGLLGGALLVAGALPLTLSYGFHPIGYLGVGLAVLGVLVSYGAWLVNP